jgi:hypothetical protein
MDAAAAGISISMASVARANARLWALQAPRDRCKLV